ncbi:MAG: nucleotidyltransferase family protein [Thermodesulfobacteriota bacterium]|nr:nucleotidyltransferase family protein [Thermodesulfobacteriota bacterium]
MELDKADRLLLDCLGSEDASSLIPALEGLEAPDWADVIRRSLRHCVAPFVYQCLKRLNLGGYIPTYVLLVMKEIYIQNAARNVRLYHNLSTALKILKDDDIPFIVLKGAHLAEAVYDRRGERTLSDVDLLFRKKDLSRCQKRLIQSGCYPAQGNMRLDIHWDFDLTPSGASVDIEGMWDRAEPSVIAGVEVLVLSPEDLILHLCLHLAIKNLLEFVGLRTFCDIRETIRCHHGQIRWEKLGDRAREGGAGNGVYLTLSLARGLVNASVPDTILDMLMPDNLDPFVIDWALDQIFWNKGGSLSLSPYFWQLWKPGPLRERIAHFLQLICPSPELLSKEYHAPYGSSLNYFYYMLRFKDHFSRYIRATWKMVIRDEKMLLIAEQQRQNSAMMEWFSSSQGPVTDY